MNSELEIIKKLYEQRRRGDWSQKPKQTIFYWKCPKCNHKLKRQSFKAPLYAEAGKDEFANRVIEDHGAHPGFYHITMDHFTCSCGYEFLGERLDQVEM